MAARGERISLKKRRVRYRQAAYPLRQSTAFLWLSGGYVTLSFAAGRLSPEYCCRSERRTKFHNRLLHDHTPGHIGMYRAVIIVGSRGGCTHGGDIIAHS